MAKKRTTIQNDEVKEIQKDKPVIKKKTVKVYVPSIGTTKDITINK